MRLQFFTLFLTLFTFFSGTIAQQNQLSLCTDNSLIGKAQSARQNLIAALVKKYDNPVSAHQALSACHKEADQSMASLACALYDLKSGVPLRIKKEQIEEHNDFLKGNYSVSGARLERSFVNCAKRHIIRNPPAKHPNGLYALALYHAINSPATILLQRSHLYNSSPVIETMEKMAEIQAALLDNGADVFAKEYAVDKNGAITKKNAYFMRDALVMENMAYAVALLKKNNAIVNEPVIASIEINSDGKPTTPLVSALTRLKYMSLEECNAVEMAHTLLDYGASPVAGDIPVAALFIHAIKDNPLRRDDLYHKIATDRAVGLMKRFLTFWQVEREILSVRSALDAALKSKDISTLSGWHDICILVNDFQNRKMGAQRGVKKTHEHVFIW